MSRTSNLYSFRKKTKLPSIRTVKTQTHTREPQTHPQPYPSLAQLPHQLTTNLAPIPTHLHLLSTSQTALSNTHNQVQENFHNSDKHNSNNNTFIFNTKNKKPALNQIKLYRNPLQQLITSQLTTSLRQTHFDTRAQQNQQNK